MSIDSKHFLRSITDKMSSGMLDSILSNPLCIGIMITFAFIIIMMYFHDDKHYFRTTVRLLFVSVGLVFVNNHLLLKDIRNKQSNEEIDGVLNAIDGGDFSTDTVLPFQ